MSPWGSHRTSLPQLPQAVGGEERKVLHSQFFLKSLLFCFSAFHHDGIGGATVIGRQLLRQMLGRKAGADGKQLCEGDKGRKKK